MPPDCVLIHRDSAWCYHCPPNNTAECHTTTLHRSMKYNYRHTIEIISIVLLLFALGLCVGVWLGTWLATVLWITYSRQIQINMPVVELCKNVFRLGSNVFLIYFTLGWPIFVFILISFHKVWPTNNTLFLSIIVSRTGEGGANMLHLVISSFNYDHSLFYF